MNKNWKLTNDTYEFIKGEVIHIYELYDIKCIPVNGFEIAIKMGITLVPYSSLSKSKLNAAFSESQDGLYIENDGKEYIFYNDINRSYTIQNMTILHGKPIRPSKVLHKNSKIYKTYSKYFKGVTV